MSLHSLQPGVLRVDLDAALLRAAAAPLPIDLAEPDPFHPAVLGDPYPRHLFMRSLEWPEPLPPVLRKDRAPAGSLLDALSPWLEADWPADQLEAGPACAPTRHAVHPDLPQLSIRPLLNHFGVPASAQASMLSPDRPYCPTAHAVQLGLLPPGCLTDARCPRFIPANAPPFVAPTSPEPEPEPAPVPTWVFILGSAAIWAASAGAVGYVLHRLFS